MDEADRLAEEVKEFDPLDIAAGIGALLALAENSYGALDGADALALVTEWNEFREPDYARMRSTMRTPVIFDGRNIYSPEQIRAQGFTYVSMGRPSPS